jgi:hypothetical protein
MSLGPTGLGERLVFGFLSFRTVPFEAARPAFRI